MSGAGLVDVSWLKDHLDDPDVLVVDASIERGGAGEPAYGSGRAAFEREHVPGAQHADLLGPFSVEGAPAPFTRPSAAALAAAAEAIGVTATTHVVVYDRLGGAWASRVWWLLRTIGHDEVSVLDGGLTRWLALGGEVEAGPPAAVARGRVVPVDHPELVVDTDEVAALSAGPTAGSVVCALRREQYAGEEGDDPRRGHVPGSTNVPFPDLLTAEGTLDRAAAEELATRFAAEHPDGIVTYCGGGINAAGLALALHVGGYDAVRLYDGSMSAWRARADLPVARGWSG